MRCFSLTNAASTSCVSNGNQAICDYYICSDSVLCDEYAESFATTQAAIDAAAQKPDTNISRFFFVTAGTDNSITVPSAINGLSFNNMGLTSSHYIPIGELKFVNSSALRFLSFDGILVGGSILLVDSMEQLDFSLNNSQISSSLSVSGGEGSNFLISNQTVLGPNQTLWLKILNGTLIIRDSFIHQNTSFHLEGNTKMSMDQCQLTNDFWVTLQPLSSLIMTNTDQISSPTVFFSKSSRFLPYEKPEGEPERERQITLAGNFFNNSVTLLGSLMSGHLSENRFAAVHDRFEFDNDYRTNRTVPHYSPNLIVGATCISNLSIVNNSFESGTFFLDYPAGDRICQIANPYKNGTVIEFNRFPAAGEIQFTTRLQLKLPLPPAMSTTTSLGDEIKSTMSQKEIYETYQISVERNFWGSAFGPWLCCNDIRGGSWVTTFLNPSQWCLDPECTRFSTTLIPQACVSYGCPQNFSSAELIALIMISLSAFIAIINTLIVVAYRIVVRFSLEHLKNIAQVDLIRRMISILISSLVTSCFADLASIATVLIILHRNGVTPIAPGQHLMEFTSLIVNYILASIAGLHLSLNVLLIVAGFLHKTRPTLLSTLGSKFYVWNVLFLCITSVLSFVWIPHDILDTKKFQGGDDRDITNPSLLSWVIYVPIVINLLSGLLVLVPTHTLNQLMYHFEYATINTALEGALLKGLASSPKIHRRILVVRVAMVAAGLVGLCVLGFIITGIIYPERFYSPGIRFLAPKYQFRVRSGVALIFSIFTFVAIVLNFVLTFSYNRVALLTALIIVLLASSLSGSYDVIFWIHLRLNSFTDDFWCDLNIGFNVAFTLCSLIVVLLLYFLRAHILKIIPQQAVTNLNQHLDLIWSASPHESQNQYIPILTDDSNDESLASSVSSDAPVSRKFPSINH
jgi:hypothetical protein